ncbi:hypothetical protein EDB83DRAFT_2315917 [Lactarius deliciosus]|nr:hypothetical protein EDB83DRAFT_2315917 [Lactarius deliciosus]
MDRLGPMSSFIAIRSLRHLGKLALPAEPAERLGSSLMSSRDAIVLPPAWPPVQVWSGVTRRAAERPLVHGIAASRLGGENVATADRLPFAAEGLRPSAFRFWSTVGCHRQRGRGRGRDGDTEPMHYDSETSREQGTTGVASFMKPIQESVNREERSRSYASGTSVLQSINATVIIACRGRCGDVVYRFAPVDPGIQAYGFTSQELQIRQADMTMDDRGKTPS